MVINGNVLAGVGCAAFVSGLLLGATILVLYQRLRRSASGAQHRQQMWYPQPNGFDHKEHNIMTTLESDEAKILCEHLQSAISHFAISAKWKELSTSTLHALTTDAFATASHKMITIVHLFLPKTLRLRLSLCLIGLLSPHLFSKPETRISGLTHLLSVLVFPNISLGGFGPAEWNLLSPHLAGLAQEIAELQKKKRYVAIRQIHFTFGL
ncbi:hypothetical protein G7Y89_g7041 [Cudoniella acicularis]|uniref:Uncharacterized protein n=1 Tax=Cudoniella acicularis TaxID=354080 RepID=A0A8H4RLJ2_9HELO|nr:hypothetical protein G7Y89_g7041 [Cudoniella acicularis]